MKQTYDLVVVIPVGPAASPEFLFDNIYSILYYVKGTCKIVLADDSHKGLGKLAQEQFPQVEIDIVPTPKPMGRLLGLYITLCTAFKHAVTHYHFGALLKLDTDALLIGDNPAKEAIEMFASYPSMGMAGQYPNEYNGKPWDIGWPKQEIIKICTTISFIRKPIPHWALLTAYRKALKNGYQTGESVFGGSYFMSEKALLALHKASRLPDYRLKTVNLEEDHMFSMLVMAAGFQLGDLSSGSLPMACTWRGLPASPEELYERGKKIIHSTRYWQEQKEEEIRAFFKKKRRAPQESLQAETAN